MPIAAAAAAAGATQDPGMLLVVLMGIGTVFFGLICIIFLTLIMGKIMSRFTPPPAPKNDTITEVKKVAEAHPQQTASGIPTDVVVAIMAALSEEPGISSRGWNITSIKKSI